MSTLFTKTPFLGSCFIKDVNLTSEICRCHLRKQSLKLQIVQGRDPNIFKARYFKKRLEL